MDQKPMLYFYRSTETTPSGYVITFVHVFAGRATPIAETIAGCVDNRAGYRDATVARSVQDRCERMQARGVASILESAHGESVTLRFQHYGPAKPDGTQDYCQAGFDLGNHYREQKRAIALVERISRKDCKLAGREWSEFRPCQLTPERAIAALRALRAVECQIDPESYERVLSVPPVAPETQPVQE